MSLVKVLGPQRSGLLALADGFRDYLALPFVAAKYADERVKVPVVTSTGFKQREQQGNADPEGANRIAFMPGWGLKSRTHGPIEQPHRQTSSPRTLFTWRRKFTVSVWSADVANENDEEAQLAASDTMIETLCQGLVYVGTGSVLPGEPYQDEFSANRTFGIELLVPISILLPIYDLPADRITDAKPRVSGQFVDTLPPRQA